MDEKSVPDLLIEQLNEACHAVITLQFDLQEAQSTIKELNERILDLERDLDNAIANGEDYKRNYPSNWDGEY